VVHKANTGETMSLETLETVFRRGNEYLEENPDEQLQILWHGGEPLLPGSEYYRTAYEFQKRHCPHTSDRIDHSVQTNLTCFDESFVEPFRLLGISGVGTSYDPEPGVRGPGEKIDSDTYNRRFMRGLSILERNGFGWGMIYVVTKKSLARPLDAFYFLTNLRTSGGIMMNPVLIYDEERRDMAVSAEEYCEFLGALFPTWWSHRERYPEIEPFRMLTQTIVEGRLSLGCADSGACTYTHVNVAPDGGTSQCGRSADWGLLPYGNIIDTPLTTIMRHASRAQLDERQKVIRDGDCAGCRFWDLCHGGCPLDAYSQHKSFMHKSEWCAAKRLFITKYFEPTTGVRYEADQPDTEAA
jgi:uncharacterized protein